YDAAGQVIAQYDGWVSANQYDRLTTMAYDTAGDLIAVATGLSTTTPAHRAVTAYYYDVQGRRTDVLEAADHTPLSDTPATDNGQLYARRTHIEYDLAGNVLTQTVGQSNELTEHPATTSYGYDALNRDTRTTEA